MGVGEVFKDKHAQYMLLTLVALAALIDGLDASIVNVALPVIAEGMGVDVSTSSWIITSYVVPIAGLSLIFGKFFEVGNIRKMFQIGLVVFTLASVGCGISWEFSVLIIFRIVQGIGAAITIAALPVMIVRLLPSKLTGYGMAIMAAAGGVAIALGPPLGGLITANISWNYLFLINVPIGILLLLMTLKATPKKNDVSIEKMMPDRQSCIFFFTTISTAVIFLQCLFSSTVPKLALIVLGVVAVVSIILLINRLLSSKVKHALLSISLIKNRNFLFVSTAFLFTTIVYAGIMYIFPYYLEECVGMDVVTSGLYLTLAACITVVISLITGRWCVAKGCRTPALVATGLRIAFSLVFFVIKPEFGIFLLLMSLITMGASFGISGTSQPTRMIDVSSKETKLDAASFVMTVNYVGAALGVALYAIVFAIAAPESIGIRIHDLDPSIILQGFHGAALFGALICVVAFILSFVVKNVINKDPDDSEEEMKNSEINSEP